MRVAAHSAIRRRRSVPTANESEPVPARSRANSSSASFNVLQIDSLGTQACELVAQGAGTDAELRCRLLTAVVLAQRLQDQLLLDARQRLRERALGGQGRLATVIGRRHTASRRRRGGRNGDARIWLGFARDRLEYDVL